VPDPSAGCPSRSGRSHPRPASLVACGLAIAAAGCSRSYPVPFPLDVGYQPLEANEASLPVATAADSAPETLGDPVMGHRNGRDFAHGQGYVKAPLAEVWTALHDPKVSELVGPSAEVVPGTEPFPISFSVLYTIHSIIGTVEWELAYRAGPLEGTVDAPQSIGMRRQEIVANQYVRQQAGSLVATPVQGRSNVTAIAFVVWLDATDSGPEDAWGGVQNWFDHIVAKVHAAP